MNGRDRELILFSLDNPRWTSENLAIKFGVSRERIRQILSRNGVVLTKQHGHKEYGHCAYCGRILYKPNNTCGRTCHYAFHHVRLKCSVCGRLFWRMKSQYRKGLEYVCGTRHSVHCDKCASRKPD